MLRTLLVLSLIAASVRAQEAADTSSAQSALIVVDVTPQMLPNLEEGMAAMQREIVYPMEAKRAGIEGRVIVQFVVDEQGDVVDPVVVRGIGGGCDEEAVRAVETLRFTPGEQRGRTVKVQMTIPITFRLRSEGARASVRYAAVGLDEPDALTVKQQLSALREQLPGKRFTLVEARIADGELADLTVVYSECADEDTRAMEQAEAQYRFPQSSMNGRRVRVMVECSDAQ